MSVTLTSDSEEPYRISIKTTTKGHHYWDVTVRAESIEQAKLILLQATSLAKETCVALNLAEQGGEGQ